MINEKRFVVLIAPNVSEQFGGEAIKALQIFRSLKKHNIDVVQITHERCKAELSDRLKISDVYYIKETAFSYFLWYSVIFRKLQDFWFSVKAVQLGEQLAAERGKANRSTVIHQTEPNSPVLIRQLSKVCFNVIGPINGNIYFPKAFRRNETFNYYSRRILHFPLQRLSAILFRRFKHVDVVFAAGGDRTTESLVAAGYSPDTIKDTLDCGIEEDLLNRPKLKHGGVNCRFVHYGRLVFHKGTFLAIESLKEADDRICLDIIGEGPELESYERLVKELRLESRVHFLGWRKSHKDLIDSLAGYRGMVFPSFQDANGIVVQEAMAIGLPPICLRWGGPSLLVEDGKTGFLIDPTTRGEIPTLLARAMSKLSFEPEVAERMSTEARKRAEDWRWSTLTSEWLTAYEEMS